jgi:hypothetical protein
VVAGTVVWASATGRAIGCAVARWAWAGAAVIVSAAENTAPARMKLRMGRLSKC